MHWLFFCFCLILSRVALFICDNMCPVNKCRCFTSFSLCHLCPCCPCLDTRCVYSCAHFFIVLSCSSSKLLYLSVSQSSCTVIVVNVARPGWYTVLVMPYLIALGWGIGDLCVVTISYPFRIDLIILTLTGLEPDTDVSKKLFLVPFSKLILSLYL